MPSTKELRQSDPLRGKLPSAATNIDARALFAKGRRRRNACAAVRRACLEHGVLLLKNAIDSVTLAETLAQMERFFSLADDNAVKRAVGTDNSPGGYGWTPLFGEPAYQPGTVAYVESFDCGPSSFQVDKPVGNRWPAIPGFRTTVRSYWDEAMDVAGELLEVIAEAVELNAEFFSERCARQDLSTLRLLNYPANDAPNDDKHVGIAAHTDFEVITLLYQSAPGLQIQDVHGDWYEVPSAPGQLVVLLGDMLERWTNGELKATGHRVCNARWHRQSVVLFVAANPGLVVAPLPRFVTPSASPLYAPVTQDAHIEAELARAG